METKTVKTTLFNLIILDESGSMRHLTNQTIAGCNETINVAKSAAEENADAIRALVSVYAFQNGTDIPSRYIMKNVKAADARHITANDYRPWGNTPLLDAVGSTLTELKAVCETHENASGIVTIITDGYENSSTDYTWAQVAALISQLKELGWTINLIGANIDVDAMAKQMHIDNHMAFQATQEGTQEMWETFNFCGKSRMGSYAAESRMAMTDEQRKEERKKASKGFFSKF